MAYHPGMAHCSLRSSQYSRCNGKYLCSWREVLASPKAHIWTEGPSSRSASDTAMSCSSSCLTKCLPCKLSIPCQLLVLAYSQNLGCVMAIHIQYCWVSISHTQEEWVLLGQTMLNDVTLRMRWGPIDHCPCAQCLLQGVMWNTPRSHGLEKATKWSDFLVVVGELSTAVLSHSSLYFCWKKNWSSGQLSEQPEALAAAEPDSTKLHTRVKLGLPWSSSSRVVPEQSGNLQLPENPGDLQSVLQRGPASSSHPRQEEAKVVF